MKTKIFIIGLFVVMISASCEGTTIVAPKETAIPLLTQTFTPLPPTAEPAQVLIIQTPFRLPFNGRITPTPFRLPFNDQNVESEYCQVPSVNLSAAEAEGLSGDEIAETLMSLHLAYFNAPEAPNWCRIDGYKIEKVFYDERTPYLPLEPKGDIMRVVLYSIKLIQVPNFWMSLSGEVDQQNWLHTGANLAIFYLADEYTMKFAHP